LIPQPPFGRPQNHVAWIGTIYDGIKTGNITNYKRLSSFMGVSQNVLWQVKGIDNYLKATCQYIISFVDLKKTNYLWVNDYIFISTFKTKHLYELLVEPQIFYDDIHKYFNNGGNDFKSVNDDVIVEYVLNNIICLEKISIQTAKIEVAGSV
jgi:hypothetical protein